MEYAALAEKPAHAAPRIRFTGRHANDIAWAVTLAAGWFWTCRQLALTWSSDSNYRFGYFVPFIAILLAVRRIADTPGCLSRIPRPQPGWRFVLYAGAVIAWIAFLFAELVREFDPHWRMVGWTMVFSLTLLSAVELARRGGGKLLGAMAFPLAFMWTGVPWPTRIDEIVTFNLRGFVTSVTVAILHALRIGALRHGNVIDLATGSVAVEPACSGISSLQVSIMASLFLGEYFRLRPAKRLLLLLAGSLLAIAANLLRVTVLLLLANQGGAAELNACHDLAGCAETAGIFLALIAMAWVIARKPAARALQEAPPGPIGGMAPVDLPREGPRIGMGSGREGCAILALFASTPFITWAWFALSPAGPIRSQNAPMWTLETKPLSAAWRVEPIALSPGEISTLDYTQAETIHVAGPSGIEAVIYHFYWKTDASTGFGHTPDSCMAGSGWDKEGEPVPVTMRINDTGFPSKMYRFTRDGSEQVVFQTIWYGGDPMLSEGEFPDQKGHPRTSRLAMLWEQPRRRGLESLNVYMSPAGDPETQTREAEAILTEVLVPNRAE